MLEGFVKAVVQKMMKTEFPHLELPAAICARITKRRDIGEGYEYNLKILDENKQIDDSYPEIPRVRSKQGYEIGDVVAVTMLYGKLNPYILGEVI